MIAQRLNTLRQQLPEGVRLVAVSKFHPVPRLQEAYDAGQRLFGENRAQELAEKAPQLPRDIEWHFIGTLQRNKVKYIMPYVHTIQSVDSLPLLEEILRQAVRFDRHINILLEYKIATEKTKSGLSEQELYALVDCYLAQPDWQQRITIRGLMSMASLTDDDEQIRREFSKIRQMQANLRFRYPQIDWTELSMGMSSDWQIALREGTTMIRIGTAIFGEREY